ncbi:MAG: ferredoxin [Lentisphaeria bacterium]|nr:ferredoxin [Lentisphaeria bacterium]
MRKPSESTGGGGETRRGFLRCLGGGALGVAVCGATLAAARRGPARRTLWQIDPAACVQCGLCATSCVLPVSAVKCVHNFAMCGYCRLCFGYFEADAPALNAGAENQMCPTGAIQRRFVEDPYHEYTIREDLCIGCGRCVKGCTDFGNGSLYLQVRHDVCVHCEECAIATVCPTQAFRRVPADDPYLRKGAAGEGT